MKTVALFFAIFISISACQQERVEPEVPESAQEDTVKVYPPKANHVTKHMAEVTRSTHQDPEYVDTLRWPYEPTANYLVQVYQFAKQTHKDFKMPFDTVRVTITMFKNASVLTYPITEEELPLIQRHLALD